jgi:hypothetical protein
MAQKVVIDIDVKSAEAEKQIENLNEDLKQTEEDLSGIEEAGDKMTGGLISGFKGMSKSVKSAIKGLKTLRGALIATGIGAFALAIVAVTTALTNSEAGQNRFAKWLTQISVVIGNVTDILGNFGNAILSFVTGNFDEAAESIAKVTEGIKNFGEETRKELAIAGELSDMRAKADKAERDLQVQRAKADRTRADLLEKAVNKEKFTVEERISFLEEAGRLEEEITNKEIKAAQLRLEARQLENSLSASTKEDLDEEARLKAELIQLETAKLTKQKEVTSQTIALKAEEAAALKAIEDEQRRVKEEQDKIDEEKKIAKDKKDEEAKKKKAEQDAEAAKIKQERDARILAMDIDIENRRTAAKKASVDAAISLFGAETAAGKAALIAKQVMAAQEMIQEARKTLTFSSLVAARSSAAVAEGTAQTAKIGFPQNIPMLIAYALQAVGIVQSISQAVGKSKSVASSIGGGGGAGGSIQTPQIPTSSAPPAFNVVGTSGSNQLAGAIASQQQQPVKAFVVSNDVTTAQELDRNIVSGATIG